MRAASRARLNKALERMNDRCRLADELEGVLNGVVELDALLNDGSSFGEPMDHCFHGLQHYLADADIRTKDSIYRSMQETEMRHLIDLLRSEAPLDQLRSVSFLGRSRGK